MSRGGGGALSHGDLSDARLSPKTSVWDDTVIFDSSFFIFRISNETLATLRRLIQTSDMPSDNFQMGDSS